MVIVGFVFGIWLIAAANPCNAPGAMDEDEDCDLDFEIDTMSHTAKYMFQVFIGTGDLGGVVEQGIAILFMAVITVFGTLLLGNLLIALMTTQYENVEADAKSYVIYHQVFDIRHSAQKLITNNMSISSGKKYL